MTYSTTSLPEPTIDFEQLNPPESAPCAHMDGVQALREQGAMHFGTAKGNPFWMVTRMADVRSMLQNPATFSNRALRPDIPKPPYRWIPEHLDPPEHTTWRRLMGPLFSPGRVEQLTGRMTAQFNSIIDSIEDRGSCDFVADVALRFPNTIFMDLMGLPISDAAQFQDWETAILHRSIQDPEGSFQAMAEVMDYFKDLIAERRRQPREDIVTIALGWRIDGAPASEEELLSFCLLLFMAGLDTVATQLTYSFYHLANNAADRRRIVADEALIPSAVEEFLRYYAFLSPGREVMADTEIAGCPVQAGQIVWAPLASANRDPREFPNADRVLIDRTENRHLSFGGGPHRCLGSHLARQELVIAMREWHRRIPEYAIDEHVTIREHGGQVGLDNLPLIWKAAAS